MFFVLWQWSYVDFYIHFSLFLNIQKRRKEQFHGSRHVMSRGCWIKLQLQFNNNSNNKWLAWRCVGLYGTHTHTSLPSGSFSTCHREKKKLLSMAHSPPLWGDVIRLQSATHGSPPPYSGGETDAFESWGCMWVNIRAGRSYQLSAALWGSPHGLGLENRLVPTSPPSSPGILWLWQGECLFFFFDRWNSLALDFCGIIWL